MSEHTPPLETPYAPDQNESLSSKRNAEVHQQGGVQTAALDFQRCPELWQPYGVAFGSYTGKTNVEYCTPIGVLFKCANFAHFLVSSKTKHHEPWNRAGVRRDRAAAQERMRIGDLREEARALSDDNEENEIVQQEGIDYQEDDDENDDDGGGVHYDDGEINNNADNDLSDGHDEINSDMDIDINRPEEDVVVSGDEGGSGASGDAGSSGHSSSSRNLNLLEELRTWALNGVSANKVDEILSILQPHHPFLPKTYRTLVKTPPSGPIHWRRTVTRDYLETYNEVVVDINIDGVPLHNSSSAHFFDILGCLRDKEDPFIIAIWHGFADKPNDLRAFLNDFVEEVQIRLFSPDASRYNFRIRNYILDAVARSFVKCCVGQNAIFACEKCDIQGVWYRHRTTYTSLEYNLRTDESFRNRENPLHHQEMRSPLEDLGTGLVSQFRLDPLHLIFLGCFKRWLHFILSEREDFQIKPVTPSDFAKRPRILQRNGNKLKGTELRRLLLYDGLRVFKHLNANIFQNYLPLQCVIYILSSEFLREYLDIANDIIQEFVSHSRRGFGRHFVVYNVHSLRHIVEESEDHGTLSDFDAFKYENYLGAGLPAL
ncbi:Halomucin [Frankliniella fusca]|uniref:Halomucin n=1 Tax=Frankliniella fusca TaxID=407009 RepID=A0AAE1LCG8_9NEOP|nr:Halomucin [Frankliniella fusca]